MSKDRVLICRRVLGSPHPPVESRAQACDLCGSPVWAAKSSPKAKLFWCQPCARVETADGGYDVRVRPTKRQTADILAYWRAGAQ
jgi:hypothetical protein